MGWITEIAIAICAIIVTGGATAYFLVTRMVQKFEKMDQARDRSKQLEKRLDELEKRLTDVQDVVLSLDDPFNHPPRRPEPETQS